MNNRIRLGVRLFSFRNMYSLEDSLRKIAAMGVDGFDITASQTIPGYPWPSEEYIEEFISMYKKHGLQLISYDGNIDVGIRSDRQLTDDERYSYALNDIMYAKKFGAKISRIQWHLNAKVLERLASRAEMFGIKAGIEIHSPLRPKSPVIQEYVEMLERLKSPYIGLIPDFGAFALKPHKGMLNVALAKGMGRQMLDYLVQAISGGVSVSQAKSEMRKMGATEKDFDTMSELYHSGFGTPDLQGLKAILPYCIHFHGKFYEFDENGNDGTIPIEDLLPMIRDYGFDGYIASEYEGHFSSDADPAEMVGRQLKLYRKTIGA